MLGQTGCPDTVYRRLVRGLCLVVGAMACRSARSSNTLPRKLQWPARAALIVSVWSESSARP
eukprot:11228001-Lingulodinium_polyedra.AAC.1